MSQMMVLTEDEATELVTFLVSAARIQLDEAPRYAPMRLLTAAERLSTFDVRVSRSSGHVIPRKKDASKAELAEHYGLGTFSGIRPRGTK